jgi:hypothetical protein
VYNCDDIKLTSISGNKLNTIGKVFIRVQLGDHSLCISAYVVSNMRNRFVLGNDVLAKHRIIIDYEKQQLLIKSETDITTMKEISIPPRTTVNVTLSTKNNLMAGLKGEICQKLSLNNKGLKVTKEILSIAKNSLLQCKIFNNTDKNKTLNKNTCIGRFYAVDKEYEEILNKETTTNLDQTNLEILYDSFIADHEELAGIVSDSNKSINFNLDDTELTVKEKNRLIELLNKNRDCFARHPYDLGNVKTQPCKFELKPGAQPIKCLPHIASPKQREIIDSEVQKLLEAGIIEEANSPYASPVVLIPKGYDEQGKVTEYRLTVDLRKMNDLTIKTVYPLPLIADFLDSIGGSEGKKIEYFTTLDAAQGYYQIPLEENSRDYTAFATHSGTYRHTRLPMGHCNSSQIFMSTMNNLFRKLLYKNVLIYLDDILIFSSSLEEHMEVLQKVFDILRKADLKLKAIKCRFALKKIKFVGHIISEEGILPDPNKLQAVEKFPVPKNLKQTRSYIGLCSFYRRFIPNFSKICQPLTKLTCKDTTFIWSEECQESFELLKQALLHSPIVAFPDYTKNFILYTDASGKSLSGILHQTQEGKERVIAYTGRNMLPAETRRELSITRF